jgi:hypothetical protein
MRHRAPRNLPALLRLHRAHPRRRLARLVSRPHPASWLPSRPSVRMASGLATMVLLVGGGALAVGALDDDTVPTVDDATPDRSSVPGISRSSDPATLSPLSSSPDGEDTLDRTSTPQGSKHQAAPDVGSSTQDTRTQPRPAPPSASSLPVRTPDVPADRSPSLPGSERRGPAVPTQARPVAGAPGPGGSSATPVDRAAPGTVLDAMPDQRGDSPTAGFSFHADEDASFTCSLDGAAFRPCGSEVEYDVRPGWHDFAVRATDRAGNVDPTPATWHWHTSGRD